MDHILGYKSNLGNFKKIEIISSIFSDHNAIQLEINNKKKTAKNTNTWRLNNMLLNNQWITEEIKEEIKKYLAANDNEDMTILNSYAPNIGSPQYIRQLLTTLKGQIDNNTIIVGNFNTPLTAMDRSTRQKNQ